MRSDRDEMSEGLRLATIAIVSAVFTATLVIGAGQALTRPDIGQHISPDTGPDSGPAAAQVAPVVQPALLLQARQ